MTSDHSPVTKERLVQSLHSFYFEVSTELLKSGSSDSNGALAAAGGFPLGLFSGKLVVLSKWTTSILGGRSCRQSECAGCISR